MTVDPDSDREAFLRSAGWQRAGRCAIAGDASSRRFLRLSRGDDRAILMIDDGAGGGGSGRFVAVGRWLAAQGCSAPRILAADAAAGLLLVEDLGDRVAAREVAGDPALENEIYGAAADLLADLSKRAPPEGLERLGSGGLGRLAALAWEWYAPVAGLMPGRMPADAGRMGDAVARAAAPFDRDGLVVSLRDFHAENILWRPERQGLRRVGLVDFQDAVLAHPVYDLVSLVQDARRDVGAEASANAVARYCRTVGRDPAMIAAAMAAVGAARALRILGVFARLALRDGKTRYVPMIPRVWGHLMRDLAHPSLADLRATVDETLTPPDTAVLARLTAQAGRHPSAAMVFAAGLGTRMRPLTDRVPKPLIRVGGKALIDHALAVTQGSGVDRVVVNLHWLAPMIRRHLGDRDPRLVFSEETDRLLETGGGLRRALPLLGPGAVFTLNTDAVWLGPNPFAVLRAAWDPDRMGALLLLVPRAAMIGHSGPGDFAMDGEGRLSRAPGLVYCGTEIIDGGVAGHWDEAAFSLNRVWDRLLDAGRLFGTVYPGRVADIGRPDAIALAEAAMKGVAEVGARDTV